MIKLHSLSRSPATAAAGSALLIVTAIVGVILAVGIESGSPTSGQPVSAPANLAPLVLPKPCAVTTRQRQTCGATGARQRHAKQVKRQPAQPVALPAPTVVPTATGP